MSKDLNVSSCRTKLCEADDVEAYLTTFEHIATVVCQVNTHGHLQFTAEKMGVSAYAAYWALT